MTHKLSYLLLLSVLFLFASCDDDDDPIIENEEEVITGVTLTLTPTNGGTPSVFTFSDPDGDGSGAPVITNGDPLMANTTYSSVISFTSPDGSIDPEIRDEDDEHQVFYVTSNGLNLDFSYDDSDDDGNPLGLLTTAQAGDASNGTLTATLRHEPTKGSSVGITDLQAAGGETDIEVAFDVTVQ